MKFAQCSYLFSILATLTSRRYYVSTRRKETRALTSHCGRRVNLFVSRSLAHSFTVFTTASFYWLSLSTFVFGVLYGNRGGPLGLATGFPISWINNTAETLGRSAGSSLPNPLFLYFFFLFLFYIYYLLIKYRHTSVALWVQRTKCNLNRVTIRSVSEAIRAIWFLTRESKTNLDLAVLCSGPVALVPTSS